MNLSVVTFSIDIAKAKFDVCLLKENGRAKHKVFAQTRHGFEELVAWLDSYRITDLHACLEAPGSYGEPLALFLFEAGFTAAELRQLQALVRRLESLVKTRLAEENRLSSGVSTAAVKDSLEEHIIQLIEQIKQTERLIQKHINCDGQVILEKKPSFDSSNFSL